MGSYHKDDCIFSNPKNTTPDTPITGAFGDTTINEVKADEIDPRSFTYAKVKETEAASHGYFVTGKTLPPFLKDAGVNGVIVNLRDPQNIAFIEALHEALTAERARTVVKFDGLEVNAAGELRTPVSPYKVAEPSKLSGSDILEASISGDRLCASSINNYHLAPSVREELIQLMRDIAYEAVEMSKREGSEL